MRTCITLLLLVFPFLSICAQQRNPGVQPEPAGAGASHNSFAFIAGISTYKHLNKLFFADEDAKLFANYLQSKQGGNLPGSHVKLLVNDQVTGDAVLTAAFEWLNSKKMSRGDRIYFFLAGHGDGYLENYFFLTSEADTSSGPKNYAIQGNVKIRQLQESLLYYIKEGIEVYLIVDACRTNEQSSPGDRARASNFSSGYSDRDPRFEYINTLYAAMDGKPAYESPKIGRGHGLFTWYLVDGLLGKADLNSMNHDGNITLRELINYTADKVELQSKNIFGEIQTPNFCCNVHLNEIINRLDTVFTKNYDSALSVLEKIIPDTLEGHEGKSLAKRSISAVHEAPETMAAFSEFRAAIMEGRLMGDRSASSFYKKMAAVSPASEITDEARIILLSNYLDFAQGKINLFLSGLDVSYIKTLNETNRLQNKSFIQLERVSRVNFSQAANFMQDAISLIKNNEALKTRLEPKLWFLQARSYFDNSEKKIELKQAIQLATKALAKDSGAVHLYFLLGMLEQVNNTKGTLADQYFAKALSMESGWSKANLEIGYHYYKLGQIRKAEEFYKRSIANRIDQSYAYNNLGALYESQEKYETAEQMYINALRMSPQDSILKLNLANFYNDRGLSFKLKKNFTAAKSIFQKGINADPEYPVLYNNLGNAFIEERRYDSAEVYYRKALALQDKLPYYRKALDLYYDPENLYFNLGLCLYNEKKYKQAVEIFSSWSKITNPAGPNYKVAAQYLEETQKLLFAASNVKVKVGDRDVYIDTTISSLHTADEYFKLNLFAEAEKYYLEVIKADPQNANALGRLGNIYFSKKKYELAAQYLSASLELEPLVVDKYLTLGRLFMRQKQYEEAEKVYLKFYEREKSNKKIITALINLYQTWGKQSEAKKFEREFNK